MKINRISYANSVLCNPNNRKQQIKPGNVLGTDTFQKQQPNALISNVKKFNFFFPSFGQIFFRDIDSNYENKKEQLEKELDIFSASKKNATLLGAGISAEAYSLKKMPEIVVKQPFDKTETFEDEQKNLKIFPKSLWESQQFVARAYDDEENCYYLLSTKVKGKSPDPNDMPWTQTHLITLFDGLYKMDKEGVYHGDLNSGNVKLTDDGNVNFLDFQWTHEVSDNKEFYEKEQSILPDFVYLENAQMFEMAELPYYLNKMDDSAQAKEFLKEYLQQKAEYHDKRFHYLDYCFSKDSNIVNKAKRFEKAQSVVLKNPTNGVVKIEAEKVQFLNMFREAYKTIDKNVKNKNILLAGSYYLLAMNMAQNFRHDVEVNKKELASQKRLIEKEKTEISKRESSFLRSVMPNSKSAQKDNERKNILAEKEVYLNYKEDYLNLMGEYGGFWFEKLKSWTPDAFAFPLRHATNRLQYWEHCRHDFYNPEVNLRDFGTIINVLEKIGMKPAFANAKNYNFGSSPQDLDVQVKSEVLDDLTLEISKPSATKTQISELDELEKEILQAKKNGSWLNMLNLSMLATFKANDLSSMTFSDERRLASNYEYKFENLSKNLFDKIYKEISDYDPKAEYSLGYADMDKFV